MVILLSMTFKIESILPSSLIYIFTILPPTVIALICKYFHVFCFCFYFLSFKTK